MNRKILVTFSFAFVAILAGCSGSYSEGSDSTSSELAKKGGGPGKGGPGKDDSSPPDDGKTPPPEKGDPSEEPPAPSDKDVPEKDPGKEPPPSPDGSCFTDAFKSPCQSDEAWKSAADKICASKGLDVVAVSTAGDCKEGSSVAKITCCK